MEKETKRKPKGNQKETDFLLGPPVLRARGTYFVQSILVGSRTLPEKREGHLAGGPSLGSILRDTEMSHESIPRQLTQRLGTRPRFLAPESFWRVPDCFFFWRPGVAADSGRENKGEAPIWRTHMAPAGTLRIQIHRAPNHQKMTLRS